jgi:hypothetical protein
LIEEFEEEKTGSPQPAAPPPTIEPPTSPTGENPTLEFQPPPALEDFPPKLPNENPLPVSTTQLNEQHPPTETQLPQPETQAPAPDDQVSVSDLQVSTSADATGNPNPVVRFSVQATRLSEDLSTTQQPTPLNETTVVNQQPTSRPKQVFTVVGQVVQRNTVIRGVVLPTLQPPPLTAEALAANAVQYGGGDLSDAKEEDLPKRSEHQSSTSSTLYAPKSTDTRSKDYSISPFRSFVESLQTISEGMTGKLDQMRSGTEKRKVDDLNVRDLYPRMPWHDVHGCLTGLPVRDLAAHFIQVLPLSPLPFLLLLFLDSFTFSPEMESSPCLQECT